MLMIDGRVGSKDLIPMLGDMATEVHLDFGDAAWVGHGEDDDVMVGVERKNVMDFLSSMDEGRLTGHQIPGMLEMYDVSYILIEGRYGKVWREAKETKLLEICRKGKWVAPHGRTRRYSEVVNILNTFEMIVGMNVLMSGSPEETAAMIRSLYRWWQKPWGAHKAHLGFNTVNVASGKKVGRGGRRNAPGSMMGYVPAGKKLVMQIVAQIPGVEQKARAISEHFSSPLQMVVADEDDWIQIPGIGKVLAKRITQAMRGEE